MINKKNFCKIGLILITIVFCSQNSQGADPQELKQVIDQKNRDLETINNQIKETQKQLEDVKETKQTLQQEVGRIDNQVRQINLGIKASEIKIDTLKAQIEATDYDISETEKEISAKKEAVAKIIHEIQLKDSNPVFLFLSGKSLGDAILEINTLVSLNEEMQTQIKKLNSLSNLLEQQLTYAERTKTGKEIESQALKSKKVIAEEVKIQKEVLLSQTKNRESTYQKSLTELEERRQEIAQEIAKIEEDLRGKIDISILPTSLKLNTPIGEEARLTQNHGSTGFAKNNYKSKWHNGIDLGAPIGTSIYAVESGRIIAVGNQDKYCYKGAYGKYIVLKTNNNLVALYAHLSYQSVKTGDEVKRGQLIGYSGSTGWSTGPHLHFSLFAGNTFEIKDSRYCGPMPMGGDLNPLDFIEF